MTVSEQPANRAAWLHGAADSINIITTATAVSRGDGEDHMLATEAWRHHCETSLPLIPDGAAESCGQALATWVNQHADDLAGAEDGATLSVCLGTATACDR